jgi:hypothetical protein
MSTPPLFLRREWFLLFAQYICRDNAYFLQVGEKKILPLQKNKKKYSISPEAHSSLTNFYSPMFGLLESIDHPGVETVDISCISNVDSFNIVPLTKAQLEDFTRLFSELGFSAHPYHHSTNWFQDRIENFERYWDQRPGKLKNTIKRKTALLDKAGQTEIIIYSAGDKKTLYKALSDYHHVYYNSWKKTEPKPSFIDSICELAWECDELRIGILYLDQNPIAGNIWFCCEEIAYIFKLAYSSNFNKYSPGSVLMYCMAKHVIQNDKVKKIDFLTGGDDYKKDWMNCSQPLFGCSFYNKKTLKGRIAGIASSINKMRKKIYFSN